MPAAAARGGHLGRRIGGDGKMNQGATPRLVPWVRPPWPLAQLSPECGSPHRYQIATLLVLPFSRKADKGDETGAGDFEELLTRQEETMLGTARCQPRCGLRLACSSSREKCWNAALPFSPCVGIIIITMAAFPLLTPPRGLPAMLDSSALAPSRRPNPGVPLQ